MKQYISYFVTPDLDFYVFLRNGKANIDASKAKAQELREKYGTYQTQWGEFNRVDEQFKELKGYYGTVWIAYKPESGRYIIADHYKTIEDDIKKRGYKLKKIILEEYEPNPWKQSYEENKRLKAEQELKDLREMIE